MTVSLELRDYQAEALDRVAAAEARGVRRQLGVAATGLGKTVMFSALAERRGGRALILAHRDELITQAAAKVRDVWPDADIGIVKGQRNEVHSHVVVASVQTLARSARLDQLTRPFGPNAGMLSAADPFSLVVVDEAHHAAADSYRRILEAVGSGEPDGPLVLGVTATPDRADGKGLDDLFDEITFTYDIMFGISGGYLSDLRALAVRIERLHLSDVKVSRGDFEAGSAGTALEAAGAADAIVEAWLEHARGRRTLVFTPTVAFAEHVAARFAAHDGGGTRAAHISGSTPLEERRRILADFSDGRVEVLANCAVLTEGFDEPRVDCVIIARPTQSRALYTQMIGRGTRRHPDKTDCLVLDIVGATDEHSLVTVPSLFGLDPKSMAGAARPLSGAVADHQAELVRAGRITAEEADLFRRVRSEGIAWVPIHRAGDPTRQYRRSLGRGAVTVVLNQKRPEPDAWLTGLHMPDGSKRVLIHDVSLETAQAIGEDYIRRRTSARGLVSADAAWRAKPPSPNQKRAAKRWHLTVDPKWTAGDLSDHLDAHIARCRARRSTTA